MIFEREPDYRGVNRNESAQVFVAHAVSENFPGALREIIVVHRLNRRKFLLTFAFEILSP
jgi:hypothetical protein